LSESSKKFYFDDSQFENNRESLTPIIGLNSLTIFYIPGKRSRPEK